MSSTTTHPSLQSDTVLMATYYQKSNGLYNPYAYAGTTADLLPAAFHPISPYGLDASTTPSHTHQTHPGVHTQPHYTPATLQNQMNWSQLAHRYGQMTGSSNAAAHHIAASVVSADYNNNRLFSPGSNPLLPTTTEIDGNPSNHRNIRQPTTSTAYQEWLASTSAQTSSTTSTLRNSTNSDLDSSPMSNLVPQQDQQVLPGSQKSQNGLRLNTLNRYSSPFHRTIDTSPPPNAPRDYLSQTMGGDMQNSLSNSPVSFSDLSVSTSDMAQTLPQQSLQPQQHPNHPSLHQQHALHNPCHQLNRLNSPMASNAYLQLPPHHPALDRAGSNDDDGLCSSDPDSSPNPLMNGSRAPFDWMRSAQMENVSKIRRTGRTRTKDKYRVVYTDFQRLELEKEFHYNLYINVIRKAELAQELGLSQRQIKIWFQNRRAKARKLRQREKDKGQIKIEPNLNDSGLSPEGLSPSPPSPCQLSGEENGIP